MRRFALLLLLLAANCWRATPSQPRAPERTLRHAVSLTVDPGGPGRLVIDRDGVAWQAHCDGAQLRVRPWQGGEAHVAGPCAHRDSGDKFTDEYFAELTPLAIDSESVAIFLDTTRELIVSSPRGERRYSVGAGVMNMRIALDGDAVVLVVTAMPGTASTIESTSLGNALAAIVRIEGSRVDVHELVRYGSTGPDVAPTHVAFGKARMLLVAEGGAARSCDYHGACSAQIASGARDIEDAIALSDGGMLAMDFDYSVTRLSPEGHAMWTKKLAALELIGESATEVWIKTRPDDPLYDGLPIVALAKADGAHSGQRAVSRENKRDRLGRYLQIHAMAPTRAGTVVRGEMAGRLAVGDRIVETTVRGAICWWENPHDGDEYRIDLDESCEGRYQKALVTEHTTFVAIDPPALRQPER